ncbi:phosphorylated adapter RNA export protein [Frankliniella occidentalis]|uniref:Phosphorylated adapter RNA export protein n=1 Tax=Frankliniella occidentalis TaxID=133901 RepID=A0A6J1TC51_FRAOC|nr:phosphorylated adapter RNA export protein [Frankliniella occidentalis]
MDECEEGEILDFDDEEEVYRPLERPSRPDPTVQLQRPRIVESESDDVTESSSDSDSSSGPRSAKKRKMHRVKPPHQSRRDGPPAGQSGARIRKNNVWTAGIQEEAIINDLENIDGLQKFSRERGVESYDFTLNQERMSEDENGSSNHEGNQQDQPDAATDEMSLDSNIDLRSKLSNKRRYEERGHVKQRLGRRPSPSDLPSDVDERLLQEKCIEDLSKSAADSVEEIARDMAKKLLETKEELILRIINTVGREKAIALYQNTQKIESEGGMLIMNGSRRRSPGGVFFFLVKNDDEISHHEKQIIFEEDSKTSMKDLKKQRRAARQKKLEQERRKFTDDIARNADLPGLLTRAELVVQQGTAINCKNGDGSVSNPPPSPATDNRGESSNDSPPHHIQIPLSNRNVAGYDDDFLDLHADDMDEF